MKSDAELIDRVQQGDVDAFAVLVGRYERLVRAAVLRTTDDRHAAEDIVQDAFLAAFQSLGRLRSSSKFGPWLLAIARNQAAHSVRRSIRYESSIVDVAATEPSRNGKLTDQSERLLELVERLPAHERIIVGLRHFEGHSVQEVAAITGRPLGTVTKQLSRAHKRLQRWVAKESKQ